MRPITMFLMLLFCLVSCTAEVSEDVGEDAGPLTKNVTESQASHSAGFIAFTDPACDFADNCYVTRNNGGPTIRHYCNQPGYGPHTCIQVVPDIVNGQPEYKMIRNMITGINRLASNICVGLSSGSVYYPYYTNVPQTCYLTVGLRSGNDGFFAGGSSSGPSSAVCVNALQGDRVFLHSVEYGAQCEADVMIVDG